MQVIRANDTVSRRADEEHFSGVVWQQPLLNMSAPGVRALLVYFEPKARTAWHSHPEGQVLYVVAGKCRGKMVDEAGEQAYEVGPGDVVYFAPDEKHWHGASPDSFMVHLAMSPNYTGKPADWLEKVRDEEYAEGFE